MSTKKLGPRIVEAIGSGSFHCGFYDEVTDEQHNHYFSTLAEFRTHLHVMPHLHKGSGACNDCGEKNTEISWYGKLHPDKMLIPPATCKPCHANRLENAKKAVGV